MKKLLRIGLLILTVLIFGCKGNGSGSTADSAANTTDSTLTDTAAVNGAGAAGGVGKPPATDSSPGAGQ